MIPEEVVDLSRLQFALTAMYHFIFVPLTLGLSFMLVIMETTYVITGKEIYRDMTKFWGKLFGINFALGVATGLTMEFQFGMNWAYYSHYVGDIFGAPLAIEGLMAFFLESTFVGLFFLGWHRLSKHQHLMVTWLVAIGSNLSALWILVANGWMQYPIGSEFNFETMRMEMTSFAELIMNPVAQVKFVHTVAAGYVTGAMFVLGISAYYLLKGRDIAFAKRSFAIAAAFGLASSLAVVVMGDEAGHELHEVQPMKLAAVEGEWETQPAPAAFHVIGFPSQEAEVTRGAIKIPYVMGIIATRSLDEEVKGIKDLKIENEVRIRNGMIAFGLLQRLRSGEESAELRAEFDAVKHDLGYGLLLQRYTENVVDATEAQIQMAVNDTVPQVAPLFWTFRLMVALGFWFILIFAVAFYFVVKRKVEEKTWLLRAALWSIPLPWIAAEAGWFVAEFGRQPWTIDGVLPTAISASTLNASDLWVSLIGFTAFYGVLLVIEMYLMFKFARLGPSSLKTGKYHFERQAQKDESTFGPLTAPQQKNP